MKYFWRHCRDYCLLPVVAAALLASGCSRDDETLPGGRQADEKVRVDWLLYEEQEQGTDRYPVRMLVSKHYLRFDDDYDTSDFLLLDRRAHTLFSVSHEESSILVIESRPAEVSLPSAIDLTEQRSEDDDAPSINGKPPVHVRFKANNELCYEAVLVPGLLHEMTKALTEYAEILGRRQLSAMETIPKEMQTPCFLSRYVYRPARHYREGLPVREWDAAGYVRTLLDYGEKREVSRRLFQLPNEYELYRIN